MQQAVLQGPCQQVLPSAVHSAAACCPVSALLQRRSSRHGRLLQRSQGAHQPVDGTIPLRPAAVQHLYVGAHRGEGWRHAVGQQGGRQHTAG